MPETKRSLKVFLCHAHIIPLRDADREHVRALYARLKREGVDVWLDKEKPGGERSRTTSQARIGRYNPRIVQEKNHV